MAPEAEGRWGDEKEDGGDEIPELPPRRESEVDVNGVKTITTYRTDDMVEILNWMLAAVRASRFELNRNYARICRQPRHTMVV